jgi:hypothetical protein
MVSVESRSVYSTARLPASLWFARTWTSELKGPPFAGADQRPGRIDTPIFAPGNKGDGLWPK